jgi:hypothetical protein
MASTPSQRMGPPPRNLAVDAYGCRSGLLQTPEYKSVDATLRAHWRVPLGSSWET